MATPEERNARDTLECIMDKVEALIMQMENTLATNPTSTSALQKRIKSTEKAWTEFEDQYDQLCAIAEERWVQDQVRAEQDHAQHATFQHHYFEVRARAEEALVKDQNAEDVRLKELKNAEDIHLKALKVQQYTARWKGVHDHIGKSLEEIEAGLEGEVIDSLEVLKVTEDQLMQVKESLKKSASLMDSIITEDPEQTDAMMDSEAAKSVQAVSKIRACKKRLSRF